MINEMSKTQKISLIYFIQILLMTVLRILIDVIPMKISDNALEWIFTVITQIFIMGFVPVIMYVFLVLDKGNFKNSLICIRDDWQYRVKFSPVIWILTILAAVLMYYSNMGVAVLSNAIIAGFGFQHIIPPPTMYYTVGDMLLGLLMTAVLPGTFEELTHRGLLLNGFKQYGEKYAVLISAIMFSLMHQNIVQSVYAFYAGIILGLVTIKTRSIFPAMFMHFFNNAMSVLVTYSELHKGKLYQYSNLLYDNMAGAKLAYIFLSWIIAALLLFYVIKIMGFARDKKEMSELYGRKIKMEDFKNISRFKYNKPYDVRKDYFMVTTIILAGLTTVISFIWGMLR